MMGGTFLCLRNRGLGCSAGVVQDGVRGSALGGFREEVGSHLYLYLHPMAIEPTSRMQLVLGISPCWLAENDKFVSTAPPILSPVHEETAPPTTMEPIDDCAAHDLLSWGATLHKSSDAPPATKNGPPAHDRVRSLRKQLAPAAETDETLARNRVSALRARLSGAESNTYASP